MRGLAQETKAIPHGYTYPQTTPLARGGCAVVLYHTDGTTETCPTGADIGEATKLAAQFINEKYPGRSL